MKRIDGSLVDYKLYIKRQKWIVDHQRMFGTPSSQSQLEVYREFLYWLFDGMR